MSRSWRVQRIVVNVYFQLLPLALRAYNSEISNPKSDHPSLIVVNHSISQTWHAGKQHCVAVRCQQWTFAVRQGVVNAIVQWRTTPKYYSRIYRCDQRIPFALLIAERQQFSGFKFVDASSPANIRPNLKL